MINALLLLVLAAGVHFFVIIQLIRQSCLSTDLLYTVLTL